MRLIVAGELGPRLRDVHPFGKALTPPFIVFWNGVVLRQVKSNCADRFARHGSITQDTTNDWNERLIWNEYSAGLGRDAFPTQPTVDHRRARKLRKNDHEKKGHSV